LLKVGETVAVLDALVDADVLVLLWNKVLAIKISRRVTSTRQEIKVEKIFNDIFSADCIISHATDIGVAIPNLSSSLSSTDPWKCREGILRSS